jgi:uncharacterized membrane protein (DUF106 family)
MERQPRQTGQQSPQQKKQQGAANPMKAMLPLLVSLMVIMIMWPFMGPIGNAVNYVLGPVIGFGGRYPLLTILLAAIIMSFITNLVRFFSTDLIRSGKAREIMRAYNLEMREAKMTHDMSRLKKLYRSGPEIQKMQQEMMGQAGGGTITTVLSMMLSIPIFLWLFWFFGNPLVVGMDTHLAYPYFDVPWGSHIPVHSSVTEYVSMPGFMQSCCGWPTWLLVFIPLSFGFGTGINKVFNLISTTKWWQERKSKKI